MPMVAEAVYAMLACARIGAVHSVVFGGFFAFFPFRPHTGLQSDVVITADEGVRGGKTIPLKANTDEALKSCPNVKAVIVFKRTGGKIGWTEKAGRMVARYRGQTVRRMRARKNERRRSHVYSLYIGFYRQAQKGVLHTTGGYLVFATAFTHECAFDYKPGRFTGVRPM